MTATQQDYGFQILCHIRQPYKTNTCQRKPQRPQNGLLRFKPFQRRSLAPIGGPHDATGVDQKVLYMGRPFGKPQKNAVHLGNKVAHVQPANV